MRPQKNPKLKGESKVGMTVRIEIRERSSLSQSCTRVRESCAQAAPAAACSTKILSKMLERLAMLGFPKCPHNRSRTGDNLLIQWFASTVHRLNRRQHKCVLVSRSLLRFLNPGAAVPDRSPWPISLSAPPRSRTIPTSLSRFTAAH